MIRDENGMNIAPLFAKNSGHSASLDRQLFRFIRSVDSPSRWRLDFVLDKRCFREVSLPIKRTNVSTRRTSRRTPT